MNNTVRVDTLLIDLLMKTIELIQNNIMATQREDDRKQAELLEAISQIEIKGNDEVIEQ